jgi:hypothetical protein
MAFVNGNQNQALPLNDESDVEEEALVNDYKYVLVCKRLTIMLTIA